MAITPRSKGLGDIGAIVDRQGRASPVAPKAPVKPVVKAAPKPAPRPAPKPVAKVAPKPVAKVAPKPAPKIATTPNPFTKTRTPAPQPGGPQLVGGPAGKPILGGPPAQQAPNPFAQYGEYADRLNQEFNKQKGSYYKSDANDQYFSSPEGFIKNQADQFLNQYKINDYYAKNNPNQNPLNYNGDESPSPDNPGKSGYWNRGIDWDTGLDYGQGGEIYSGGQLYIPQADGTYLNVNSGKIMQQEIPQQDPNNPYGISIGGSQRPTFKEYTPGQAIPKQTSRPNFGNLFGPGVEYENNQPYDMPQTAPDFGNYDNLPPPPMGYTPDGGMNSNPYMPPEPPPMDLGGGYGEIRPISDHGSYNPFGPGMFDPSQTFGGNVNTDYGTPNPYNPGMMSPSHVVNQVGKPGFQPRPSMSNAFSPYDDSNSGDGFMKGSGSLFGGGGFAGK